MTVYREKEIQSFHHIWAAWFIYRFAYVIFFFFQINYTHLRFVSTNPWRVSRCTMHKGSFVGTSSHYRGNFVSDVSNFILKKGQGKVKGKPYKLRLPAMRECVAQLPPSTILCFVSKKSAVRNEIRLACYLYERWWDEFYLYLCIPYIPAWARNPHVFPSGTKSTPKLLHHLCRQSCRQ